jgi:hypothetical protein
MQHPDETLANVHMKHLETWYMLATCIDMQHLNLLLQQPDKTLAIFVWNG